MVLQTKILLQRYNNPKKSLNGLKDCKFWRNVFNTKFSLKEKNCLIWLLVIDKSRYLTPFIYVVCSFKLFIVFSSITNETFLEALTKLRLSNFGLAILETCFFKSTKTQKWLKISNCLVFHCLFKGKKWTKFKKSQTCCKCVFQIFVKKLKCCRSSLFSIYLS